MNSPLSALRTRLFLPSEREVDPAVRGFSDWEGGESIVSRVGHSFLEGYGAGLRARGAVAAVRDLQRLPDRWRGFAMEGLGMAMGVRDALRPGGSHFCGLLATAGERHGYMLYVGLGWAMARTPRMTWPDLTRLDPLLVPLVFDGYGFHEIFFNTQRVWDAGTVELSIPAWPGSPEAGAQHVMQGVGRGLWFVTGGSPTRLVQSIDRFAPTFAPSLWAGAGLASAYAGGRDEDGLRELVTAAGEHAAWLRQGASFGIEARDRADTVVPHVGLAARVLCGRDVREVTALVRDARPAGSRVDGGEPDAFELWRHEIAGAYRRDTSPVVPA